MFLINSNREGGGGLRVKIGRHIIGAWAEMGQNGIRGGWGVKNRRKSSDIIYVRSLVLWQEARLNRPFLSCIYAILDLLTWSSLVHIVAE